MVRTIIQNARLFDGTGAPMQERASILIADGQIEWCGPAEDAPPPGDAEVIDASGHTLLPGLIDCHMHLLMGRVDAGVSPERAETNALLHGVAHARRCLEAGVTSVRDLGARFGEAAVELMRAIDAGLVEGPEMIAAARFVAPTGGYMAGVAREASTPDQARAAAEEQVRAGARVLKAVASPVPARPGERPVSDSFGVESLRAIAEVAHAAGLKATAHAHGLAGARDAVEAGLDCVEHGYRLDQVTVDTMAARGVWLVPTMVAMEAAQAPQWAPGRPDESARRARERWEAAVNSVRMARAAGVRVATGTDAFGIVPVETLWREVSLLVSEGGLTPAQAFHAATGAAAELIGVQDRAGRIAPGLRADLVMVQGDALSDIPTAERISAVWRSGRRVR